MKPLRLIVVFIAASATAVFAQTTRPATDGETLRLWDGPAPGAIGDAERDVPTLTVYLPRPAGSGADIAGVIICPGGSYRALAMNHEGRQVANYLNSLGVAAFVLRYRLGPTYHHPVELGDAQRAIRLLRAHAPTWHLATDRIGIVGFSAGGHLAMTASTLFDDGNAAATDPIERASSRPDFAVLGYPVISMTAPWTHAGSRTSLLGDQPGAADAKRLSGEESVTPKVPPTFIFHTNTDTVVPAENSLYYFAALRKAGVAAELHVFERGAHGVGLANDDPALAEWSKLLANWLRLHKVIS